MKIEKENTGTDEETYLLEVEINLGQNNRNPILKAKRRRPRQNKIKTKRTVKKV